MGKKDKNKKKGKGAEKTAMKTDKKLAAKQKKLLLKIGEAAIEEIVANLESEEARLKEVTETICECPSPRSNFTLTAHPEKDEIILFGGEFFNGQKICIYNDLYFYNISKNEWRLVKSPSGPAPRSGHQMCSVAKEGGQLWLFGGEHASPSQMQFYHYKDLWVFQLANKRWEKISAPNGPSPRSGHRMTVTKKKLIVFGGFHDNNQAYKYFNDVHMFSLESYTWLKIDITGTILPPPRSGCCISASPDGKILIWGGYSKSQVKKEIDRGTTHTDMFALTPDKSQPNEKFKWTTVKPGGFKPLPRSSVGFAQAANGKVYCFGGVMDIEEDEENLRGQFGNELYCLDISNNTWRLLDIHKKEKSKGKKTGVADCEMDESKEETKTQTTTDGIFTITVAGPSSSSSEIHTHKEGTISKFEPSHRMNAGLCVIKGNLYVYGGIYEDDYNKQFTYNDLYSLDLHKLDEWKTIITNTQHDWMDDDYDKDSSGSETGSDSETETDEDEDGESMETD
ncbi:kelch domain-containing protein 4 [Condylostylus longicornis]|uniref:kelch domain-containing protein 4 n=1 Tax=Condylostylus longicornis TaxID=2530218 RepID=UPI00244D9983|nr:kelch domain-containing protein 4 [Condylostylus longicornis]